LIPYLKNISDAVSDLRVQLPRDRADNVIQDFDAFKSEIVKKSPRIEWLKTAGKGLIEVGKETGKAVLQGNRILSPGKTRQNRLQGLFVPAGAEALAAKIIFHRSVLLQNRQRQAAEQAEVDRAVILADAAMIF
jgi:hypothetical protein